MASCKSKLYRKTRADCSNCPIFGAGAPFSKSCLPTCQDILKHYLYIRSKVKISKIEEPTFAEISEIVIKDLQEIWKRASIPTISSVRINEKIHEYHSKYRKLLKPYKQRYIRDSYKTQIKAFKETTDKLFDIAACKCTSFEKCSCEKSRKVPMKERDFLTDQRTNRKMMIGSIDQKATKQILKRMERKQKEEILNISKLSRFDDCGDKPSTKVYDDQVFLQEADYISSTSTKSECSLECKIDSTKSKVVQHASSTQMRKTLPTVALECDRWGLSDRSAAAVSSALLQDMGLVSEEDPSLVIDRSKVRRARQKLREELKFDAQKNAVMLQAIYFDGRKDKTKKMVSKDGKPYPINTLEEHLVLLKEPNSEYLGHVTPFSGTSLSIKNSIINFLSNDKFKIDELAAIGCDGTNVNTGWEGGVIRLLELHFNKPLHWFVCLLHTNELPLRHLLINLDGVTHGPNSFSGPIGKALKNCVPAPVQKYDRIEGKQLPRIDINDLSNDQKYLYEIVTAVMSGNCSQKLANTLPGPISHSRWLTTASRILRLYISTIDPSDNLVTLATYIVNVYAPVWFEIKTKSRCCEGSRHLWKMVAFSRYLPQNIKNIVDTVIQRNAYFAHPENMLLSMITDKDSSIRKLALLRVLKAREKQKQTESIRHFRVPELNFEAKKYYEMITYEHYNVEPPLTRLISRDEIIRCIKDDEILSLPNMPCHTQNVERSVRLVTESSAAVFENQRDGYIRSRIKSRSIMHKFNKKSEYNLFK